MTGWWFVKKERCYNHIGCFSDEKPFDNLKVLGKKYLPDSPDKIKPRFHLFTRQSPSSAQELFPYLRAGISTSAFNSKRMTVVIIHGYSANSQDYRLVDMKRAFLEQVVKSIFSHVYCKDHREAAVIILRYTTLRHNRLRDTHFGNVWKKLKIMSITCRFHLFTIVLTLYISY